MESTDTPDFRNQIDELEESAQSYWEQKNWPAAEADYSAIIELCRFWSAIEPDCAAAYRWKGRALDYIARIYEKKQYFEDTENAHRDAIAAYEKGVEIAPEDVTILGELGDALYFAALFQQGMKLWDESLVTLRKSLVALTSAQRLAPGYFYFHYTRGLCLWSIGDLESRAKNSIVAESNYREALAEFNKTLRLGTHTEAWVYNCKGQVALSLGDSQLYQDRLNSALRNYAIAIRSFNASLKRQPDNAIVVRDKGCTYEGMEECYQALGQSDEAQEASGRALANFREALRLAPHKKSLRMHVRKLESKLDAAGEMGT